MATLPLDDPGTYDMLARGESVGVFQFESDGMREALRKVRPTELEDLVALVALYRPGAMRHIDTYARNKRNPEGIGYVDERLRPITEPTYSVILYQEQSMQIAKEIAGFSGPEADDLRKAIGKKRRDKMAALRERFFEGARATGTAENVVRELWAVNEAAADYSFNRAHAACYALIAYRTAWLKANHPCEYMAALISSVMNTKDKVPYYVNACSELGIEVLPPDVNSSQVDFAVVEGKIRFGLNAVKGVGEGAAAAIVRERGENGPYESIWDFTERVDGQVSNKRVLEALVKCGALDSTGDPRRGMLAVLDQAAAWGQKQQQDRLAGQGSIFDLGPAEEERPRHHPPVPAGEFDKAELLALEKEVLGLYVSEHPLSGVRDQLRRKTDCPLAELERRRDGEVVTVGGIVGGVKELTTKKGDPMVFLTLDDAGGQAEVVVFNSVYAAARELCATDRILVIKGRVDHKQAGETKLLAMEVAAFEAMPERSVVRLRVDATKAPAGIVRELAGVLRDFPGDAPVYVDLETSSGLRRLELGPGYRVAPSSDFYAEVKHLLGEAAVT
jgi:DNA polymerase III subunit alpha